MSYQSPFFFQQFRKADGTPLSNGNLYTYVTESVIPKALFYDKEETLPCPNPLPLDDSGFVPQYYMGQGLYTFVLKDSTGQTIATRDNVESVIGFSDVNTILSENFLPLSGGSLTGNITATSFIRTSGTSEQFLKADGSVDTNSYVTNSSLSGYLPLSGGTVFNKIGFKTDENSDKIASIYKYDYLGQEALLYDVSGYMASHRFTVDDINGNPTTLLILQDVNKSLLNGGLVIKDGLITDKINIEGTPGHKIIMADGTLEYNLPTSTGIIDTFVPEFVDNGNGSCNIASCSAVLCSGIDYNEFTKYSITSATLSFTDGIESYICIDYNSGNPIYTVLTDKTLIDNASKILVYTVWRQGSDLHSVSFDSLGLGLANKTESYIRNTQMYKKSIDGGLVLSEDGSRHILVSQAVVFSGIVPQTVSAYTSVTDKLILVSGGNYIEQNQYDNTNYSSGVLITNRYSTRWFFRSIGDEKKVFYVLGGEYTTISDAKLEQMPTVNILLRNHCVLVGRIIIQKNASSGLVENVSDTSFSTSQVQNHNDLANKQGGDSLGNYYHLSASTFSYLSAVSADIQTQLNFNRSNYLPLSGGTLTGQLKGTTISASGNISAGNASFGTWSGNSEYAWFGHRSQNNLTSGFSGILHRDNGDMVIYAPVSKSIYLGNNTSTVAEIKNTGVLVTGNISADGQAIFGNDTGSVFCSVNGGSAQTKGFAIKDGGTTRFILDIDSSKTTEFRSYTSSGTLIDTPISWGNSSSNSPILFSRNISASGNVSASSFVKSGGTSTQFLKADGSVDSNSYATTASTNRPSNEIVYGSGSGITSSPKFTLSLTSQFNGFQIYSPNSSFGALFALSTNSNTSGSWGIQKRDVQDYGTTLGCFAIEDSTAGTVSQRFPISIDAGSTGLIRVTRNISASGNVSASSFVKSGGTSEQFLKADGSVDTNVSYKLYSSECPLNNIAGGTPRNLLNFSLPAGILNSKTIRVTFSYLIAATGGHSAYFSTTLGGLAYTDSSFTAGGNGNSLGRVTMTYTASTTGSSGKVGQAANNLISESGSVIVSNQNYTGESLSTLNLNNAQTLNININESSASANITVYQVLVEAV